MDNVRILIADDHPVFRSGLRDGLEQFDDLKVIGEAENGRQALERVRELNPDLLLLDMEMPEMSGLDVARELHAVADGPRVLPLSSFSDPEYVFGVLENGAEGYLMKDEPLGTIAEAIRRIMAGGVYMSPRVSLEIVAGKKQIHDRDRREERVIDTLVDLGITPNLLTVLQLAARGLTNEEIAAKIYRSPHTVRNNLTKVKELIGVSYRPALVAWAWRNDIESIDADEYEKRFA